MNEDDVGRRWQSTRGRLMPEQLRGIATRSFFDCAQHAQKPYILSVACRSRRPANFCQIITFFLPFILFLATTRLIFSVLEKK